MLLVMGPLLGVPVNHLYSAAFGPGFLLAASISPTVLRGASSTRNSARRYRSTSGHQSAQARLRVRRGRGAAGGADRRDAGHHHRPASPPPTEAASCGALGATLLALAYRKLTLEALKNAAISTIVTSSMVLFLVVGSNLFGAVFNQLGAPSLIKGAVAVIPLPDIGKLLVIMAIIFLLGWPFEWPAIVLVFLPIFFPVVAAAAQAGADAVVRRRWSR